MEDARRTYHRLKMNARRRIRRQKRQVENITVQADNSIERHFFKRISRLYEVRRFVVSWSLLLLFIGVGAIWQVKGLDKFYLELAPVSGGTYREGIIGSFTTANPLFSVGSADVAVSELVFSGLFRLSPGSVLEPDLAIDYKIDTTGLKYTVKLRDDVYWHDGKKFTANDVVFTYNTIKNPEVKSPLFAGWSTVSVSAIDDFNVEFTLPNILSSFQFSLTNGIVPEHILGTVAAADLRSTTFNTVNPIGTGPFVYRSVEVIGNDIDKRAEKVMLESNSNYFRSVPKIDGITIRTYRDEEVMQEAFIDKEIASMVGLQTVSDTVLADESVKTFSTPLSSQVMVFMNNSSPLLNDVKVRQALLRATDTKKIRDSIGYQLVESDSPFLKSHFTYNAEKTQKSYDAAEADRLLNEAGWIKAADGMRYKNDQMLRLNLVSQSLSEYSTVARGIQQQWGELGVSVVPLLKPEEDIQSGSIGSHDYDVLLYGISVGPDPDVFAYWHSSQADPRVKSRLNLSEFKNQQADTSLESGRTRLDESLRKIKYEPFIDAWLNDTPAIALYQPRFLFVIRGTLEGYSTGEFNSPSDRFYSISNWQVRRDRIIKQ